MSAQAGILYHDARPVDSVVLERLGQFNNDRGPHATGHIVENGVALAHWSLWLDDTDRLERQPYHAVDGTAITWDGRLHNRDDLFLQLGPHLPRNCPDVDLVAAAWLKWRTDTFRRLIGDWSLALWQPEEQQVILARDFAGNRPLYYGTVDGITAWSTCLETLVALFNRYDALDEQYMAGVLTFGAPRHVTAFRDILAVPGAHAVHVRRSGQVEVRRFWDFEPQTIRYRDPGQYEERLRGLFAEAVQVRLRTTRPAWAELSGGYDSSSIVCMATHQIRSQQVSAPELRTLSYMFPDSPESDEREYITCVENFCGWPSCHIDDPSTRELDAYNVGVRPFNYSSTHHTSLTTHIGTDGHVLLSGELGDLVMGKNSGHAVALLEHLTAFRLRQFSTDLFAWCKRAQKPASAILHQLFEVCVPSALGETQRLQMLHAMARAHHVRAEAIAEAFLLNPVFVRRTEPRWPSSPDIVKRFTPSKRFLVRGLSHWTTTDLLSTPDTLSRIRLTFPFAHRTLLEYVLGIPESVLWEPTRTRALMRRSFAGFLPSKVVARQNKGYASPALARHLRPMAASLLRDGREYELVERGYVVRTAFDEQLRRLVDGSLGASAQVRKLIALEAWLRHRNRANHRLSTIAMRSPI